MPSTKRGLAVASPLHTALHGPMAYSAQPEGLVGQGVTPLGGRFGAGGGVGSGPTGLALPVAGPVSGAGASAGAGAGAGATAGAGAGAPFSLEKIQSL